MIGMKRDEFPHWLVALMLAAAAGFGALVTLMFVLHWIRR